MVGVVISGALPGVDPALLMHLHLRALKLVQLLPDRCLWGRSHRVPVIGGESVTDIPIWKSMFWWA